MLTNLRPGDAPLSTSIHPTAVIHPNAELHPTVEVGPYTIIGENVKIKAQTIIGPHVVIEGPTEIGVGNRIFTGAVIGSEPQDLKYKGAASLVKIGDYNQFREYITINRATEADEVTQIGNYNLLMAYSHIAHNCVIEDEVIIANTVALAGHVYIESKARISGVVGVHQFAHIGSLSMVAGMARIVGDVPPYTIVEGNPSRVRALNVVGLKRAGVTNEDISELKKAFRLIYRSKLTFNQALEQLTSSTHPYVQHLRNFLHQSSTVEGRRGPIPGNE